MSLPGEPRVADVYGVDGKQKLFDPAGTNPANPEMKRVSFRAQPGEHELLLALGTNAGKAWGIFLRLERLGVACHLRRGVPVAMPEILG